jgi:hypothetical protein
LTVNVGSLVVSLGLEGFEKPNLSVIDGGLDG